MEPGIHLLDQLVDVVPPPIAYVGKIAAVLGEGVPIVKGGAGVKVIVQVDAVHIVVAHDLFRPLDHQFPHLGQARVQVVVAAIFHHPLRVLLGRRTGGQPIILLLPIPGHPEGVDPGVELQAQGMGFFHPVFQRVKAAAGRCILAACQIRAPGEQIGWVEGIRTGAHLQDHSVHAHILAVLQNGVGLALQCLGV